MVRGCSRVRTDGDHAFAMRFSGPGCVDLCRSYWGTVDLPRAVDWRLCGLISGKKHSAELAFSFATRSTQLGLIWCAGASNRLRSDEAPSCLAHAPPLWLREVEDGLWAVGSRWAVRIRSSHTPSPRRFVTVRSVVDGWNYIMRIPVGRVTRTVESLASGLD